MPLVQPMPFVRSQWFDANGDPVANGFLYTYIAGTNTPLATYNDSTGGAGALNPNPVELDSGGYADVWLTAASYKLVLQDANHVQLWSIDGVPGLGSLISVGDLPPLFSSVLAGGALNFSFDSVAPYQLFGRFAGTSGDPSYGAVGSNRQIVYNQAGDMRGDGNFIWDTATFMLAISHVGDAFTTPGLRLISDGVSQRIIFGTSTSPVIRNVTAWEFTTAAAKDIHFGTPSDPASTIIGGDNAVPHGIIRTGIGSARGGILMNDGNQAAGVFAGARLICGFVADPNGTVVAETGSLFVTVAGGAATTLWVKESSPTTSTGWVAK